MGQARELAERMRREDFVSVVNGPIHTRAQLPQTHRNQAPRATGPLYLGPVRILPTLSMITVTDGSSDMASVV